MDLLCQQTAGFPNGLISLVWNYDASIPCLTLDWKGKSNISAGFGLDLQS